MVHPLGPSPTPPIPLGRQISGVDLLPAVLGDRFTYRFTNLASQKQTIADSKCFFSPMGVFFLQALRSLGNNPCQARVSAPLRERSLVWEPQTIAAGQGEGTRVQPRADPPASAFLPFESGLGSETAPAQFREPQRPQRRPEPAWAARNK